MSFKNVSRTFRSFGNLVQVCAHILYIYINLAIRAYS
jgi:hypothetical protein